MYFHDLEVTSKEFYIDYVSKFTTLNPKSRILEVGCGEGGNLAPFAKLGCSVTGVDIAECRIKEAQQYFADVSNNSKFVCCDFTKYPIPQKEDDKYDVILLHDVIEHIPIKKEFLSHLKGFIKKKQEYCLSGFLLGRCLVADTSRFAEASFVRTCHSSVCCPTRCTRHY